MEWCEEVGSESVHRMFLAVLYFAGVIHKINKIDGVLSFCQPSCQSSPGVCCCIISVPMPLCLVPALKMGLILKYWRSRLELEKALTLRFTGAKASVVR